MDRIVVNLTLEIRSGPESHPYLGGAGVVGMKCVLAGGLTGAKPALKL